MRGCASGCVRGCVRGYVAGVVCQGYVCGEAAAQQQSMPRPTMGSTTVFTLCTPDYYCVGRCREAWQRFSRDVAAAEKASMAADKGFAFAFVEGALVKAVREGWWLLLDEINLAPAEVRRQPACINIIVFCAGHSIPAAMGVYAVRKHMLGRILHSKVA